MKNYEITNIHENIVKVLVEMLRKPHKNPVISYSDLCALLDEEVNCREVANYLGDISVWSKEIGAPMLSVMVVNKETLRPGKGFFRLYTELYGVPVKANDEDVVFIGELNKVLRYKKWNELKFYLGI